MERKEELYLEIYKRKQEAEETRFYEPTTFAQWLRQQAHDHRWAVGHPTEIIAAKTGTVLRGPAMFQDQSILVEIEGRAKVYARLVDILEREGVEAAISEYKGPGLEELRNLITWDSYTDERTYWNDGKPETKEVGGWTPILRREIQKHLKS